MPDIDKARNDIHEITSLLARRIVGEASKKNLNGLIIAEFNKEADDQILSTVISEGKMCEASCHCDKEDLAAGYYCDICNGTGKLPDRDIEYAIKKCQEG